MHTHTRTHTHTVGTTLADSERVLDVQLGWGVNNPGGYRFKLVYKQGLVEV